MIVTLPAAFESLVRQKIAIGLYQDADEVVVESLGLMRQQERWKLAVTAKIDEGVQDMVEGRFLTSDEPSWSHSRLAGVPKHESHPLHPCGSKRTARQLSLYRVTPCRHPTQ